MYNLKMVIGGDSDFKPIDVTHDDIWCYVDKIRATDATILGYEVCTSIGFFSTRYNKWVVVEKGDKSDGATHAPDLDSFGWIFHDDLCTYGLFEDGTPCTNWQASHILSDILSLEKRWFRSSTWFVATWLFGGGKARKNGMW